MTRLLFAALLAASSLTTTSCVIALGKWKVSSFDDTRKKTPEPTSGATILESVQREVAVHEAGHAIAKAILFGPNEVQKVVVNTNVDDDGNLGVAHWTPEIERRYNESDMFNSAVVSLAGRAADIAINGAATSGASTDLGNANAAIWNAYISYGLKGSPIVYEGIGDTPPEIRKKIEADVIAAERLAKELVDANIDTIRALADDLMGIVPKEGKRTMEADVFKAFCGLHPLKDPRPPAKKAVKKAK